MLLIGNLGKIGFNGVFNYESGYPFGVVKANFDALFEKYNKFKNAENARRINQEKYDKK